MIECANNTVEEKQKLYLNFEVVTTLMAEATLKRNKSCI